MPRGDWWKYKTSEEREVIGSKIGESNREIQRNMSLEEREVISIIHSERQKDVWRNMSLEEREVLNSKRGKGISEALAGRSLEETERILAERSKAGRERWANSSGDERNERVRSLYKFQNKQTEGEVSVELYKENRSPGKWIYNGNGDILIGGKRPDFVNISGEKEVIEILGGHYHPDEDESKLIKHYKEYGFQCRVIWEYDCYDWDGLDRIFSKEVL